MKPKAPVPRIVVELPVNAKTSYESMIASPRWARIAAKLAEMASNPDPKEEDAA